MWKKIAAKNNKRKNWWTTLKCINKYNGIKNIY